MGKKEDFCLGVGHQARWLSGTPKRRSFHLQGVKRRGAGRMESAGPSADGSRRVLRGSFKGPFEVGAAAAAACFCCVLP